MARVSPLSATVVLVNAIALAAAIFWILYWILVATPKGSEWLGKIDTAVTSKFLGTYGSLYMLQALPIVVITIAGLFVQLVTKRLQQNSRNSQVSSLAGKPRLSVWELPAFVRSPIGMLTFAELVVTVVVLFTTFWYFGKSCRDSFYEIDHTPLEQPYPARWVVKLDYAGVYLGVTAQIPMALLWIPVSRGSAILRLTGVSFERAVKYHLWLGQLCIILSVAHGVTLALSYHYYHALHYIFIWQTDGISLLPGIIAVGSGVIMLVTSLPYIRRNYFDTFFTAHHFYIVFYAFFLFHCYYSAFYLVFPVLLFFVDRFTRFVQSRQTVDLLSVKVLSSSALELRFKKPSGLSCNPLEFVYLQVPSVSRLQWHPFSLTSSPVDQKDEITIIIKPVGWFTRELYKEVESHLTSSVSENGTELSEYKNSVSTPPPPAKEKSTCPFSLKVAIEGPYGDSSINYLKFRTLILVAGGVGITPFISLLGDILHRCKNTQKDLPSSVHLIVSVRDVNDFCILNSLDPASILGEYIDILSIQVHAYVTSTVTNNSPQDSENTMSYADFCATYVKVVPVEATQPCVKSVQKMSSVVGSGNTLWVAATVIASLLGFTVVWGIFNVTVIGTLSPNYKVVLLHFVSIAIGVVVFGGAVLLLWAKYPVWIGRRGKKLITHLNSAHSRDSGADDGSPKRNTQEDVVSVPRSLLEPSWKGTVTVGRRPNWKEKLGELAKQMGGQNVGVLVSGPPGMQEDVARECQCQAIRFVQRKSDVVFHFHSVSFDL